MTVSEDTTPIRVLNVDDQLFLCRSVRTLIDQACGLVCAGEAENGDDTYVWRPSSSPT